MIGRGSVRFRPDGLRKALGSRVREEAVRRVVTALGQDAGDTLPRSDAQKLTGFERAERLSRDV